MERKIQMSLILKSIKKHFAFRYEYKLVCVDDKFREPFKSYLPEDSVFIAINSMILCIVLIL